MILTGIGDEAGASLESQIAACKELGWSTVEMRAVQVGSRPKANFHDIPDLAFEKACASLTAAGLGVHCFGSTIMNWSKTVETPWSVTLDEVARCIPRMRKLGTRFVRIMSLKPGDEECVIPKIVFNRVREVTQRFLDAGLVPVHENCMNYGGMSWQHALELLDKCPGLKWVFDTANPVFNPDRSRPKPWPRQDPWEFWEHIRDHVVHIHVKDATWNTSKGDADYNWPGEGEGKVRAILADALARGYDGGVSIEPHMVVVFHSTDAQAADESATRANFVEYGRRLGALVESIRGDAG